MDYPHPNVVQPRAPASGGSWVLHHGENVKYGAIIVGALLVAQIVVKDEFKPNILGGKTVGDFVKAETDAARPAIVATQEQIANVQAQAQAKAHNRSSRSSMPRISRSDHSTARHRLDSGARCLRWGTFNNDPAYLKACGMVPRVE